MLVRVEGIGKACMLLVQKQTDRAIMGDSTRCLKIEYDPAASHYSVFIYPKEINQDVKEKPSLNKEFTAALFTITKIQKQPVSINVSIDKWIRDNVAHTPDRPLSSLYNAGDQCGRIWGCNINRNKANTKDNYCFTI